MSVSLLILSAPRAVAQDSASWLPAVERRSPAPASWVEGWRLGLSRGGSAPLVWADSRILVASLDRNVHEVSLDGPQVVWKQNFKGSFEAAPVVTEDRIYLAETRRGARLVALDKGSHQTLWTAAAGDLATPPVVSEGRIYTVSSTGEARAFDRSGTELWLTELETRVTSAPALVDGTLLIAASDGELFAVDPESGKVRMSTHPEAGSIWGDPLKRRGTPTVLYATLDGLVIEVDQDLEVVQQRSFPSRFYLGPLVVGEDLLMVGHEGAVWRYEWDGSRIAWRAELPGTLRAPARVSGGVVAIGSLEGTLSLLDFETGRLLWTTRLDDAITSRPLAREREFFVFTEKGTLYAFHPEGVAR